MPVPDEVQNNTFSKQKRHSNKFKEGNSSWLRWRQLSGSLTLAVALKTVDTPSTSKNIIVKQQKATIKVPDRSKPSEPVVDGIYTGKVTELTRMRFESSVSKVSNIS